MNVGRSVGSKLQIFDFEGESFYLLLLIIVQFDCVVVGDVELPCGQAHAAASAVQSTDVWESTHQVTILAFISLLTEFFRLCGKWKKLHVGVYMQVLPSYALRQQRRVNLFGFVG